MKHEREDKELEMGIVPEPKDYDLQRDEDCWQKRLRDKHEREECKDECGKLEV
ncbi:hypothetical protein SESBI_37568 [Sesbania bispinosa]|nr:hypothetical protein SESBI_37568 [Sesbania bispinosa]